MADEKKPADKAEATKKPAAKTAAAKKPAASKAAADKPAAKKAPAKAAATKKPAAKKATASKADKPAAEKKPAAKKATASKADKPAAEKKAPAKASASKTAEKPAAKKAADAKAEAAAEKVSTLKMHHLRPADGSHKRKIRVGRGEGGKRGKTAGRGTKGTGARYQVPERFEGGQTPIHMRIPKLRGFRSPFKIYYQVVNVDQIAELFPKGGKITKADLVDAGAVRKNQPVKVLGEGDISVKVNIVDVEKVSQSAKTKIEAAGGSVNEG
ncbi:50S ribosomal protein L15 [Demequina oxidasica]|uniref:50S ribosomal protein L15 n=1 Tax=Demequina oxidasica TaxID=676199 RepID=UPI0009FE64A5|nr:50S ribosomal protein L15 [Demequina oxidasica]